GPFVEQGNGQAYVMDGSTAVRRPVQLGVSSLGEVEILSGVQPGDRIVVAGSDLFKDAERVSIN
ncbi:MAG: efflux transporter periplasmic adaptor subunit, partial [Stenotrophomonas sp.]|nr:efflux transporter periplasmic adaptor subunit [Stenotrophomonas sp.]